MTLHEYKSKTDKKGNQQAKPWFFSYMEQIKRQQAWLSYMNRSKHRNPLNNLE
jgi:hypothetical protein